MDSKLRKILTDCIGDIETGARDVEGCLQRHPDRAAELRPHLELWSHLSAAPKAEPNFGSQQRGKQQLLGALSDMERGTYKGKMIPAVAKVAVVMAAAALLVGGAAGASAALGGPDVTHDVLAGIGLSNASETGRQHANDNAKEGSGNAGQGIDNASETGKLKANINNASQGSDNAAGASDGAPRGSGSVPDNANVPESVPAGPKP
ncbi:MAG: hypothetical protein IIA23_05200 [Chloroflexi bacterium]|nr:hypothetical protein [Chloroflexota bacterium]